MCKVYTEYHGTSKLELGLCACTVDNSSLQPRLPKPACTTIPRYPIFNTRYSVMCKVYTEYHGTSKIEYGLCACTVDNSSLQPRSPKHACTTILRYPIFNTRYSVMCKVYTEYHGTSKIEHGLCACTVDNSSLQPRSPKHACTTILRYPIFNTRYSVMCKVYTEYHGTSKIEYGLCACTVDNSSLQPRSPKHACTTILRYPIFNTRYSVMCKVYTEYHGTSKIEYGLCACTVDNSSLQPRSPKHACTTILRYPIFNTRYSVMCKVYTEYHGTSKIEHGLCACTVDNSSLQPRSPKHACTTILRYPIFNTRYSVMCKVYTEYHGTSKIEYGLCACTVDNSSLQPRSPKHACTTILRYPIFNTRYSVMCKVYTEYHGTSKIEYGLCACTVDNSSLQPRSPKHACTTILRYPIFNTRYSVMCKVYTEYHGTSKIEHGLCACTVDNPLAKARGLSSPR